ncbi:hypothetical protein MLD38_006696 [Melastoma candidum]|uniref:Uncharacterized protein n=1 Tax=Melastoma candidum TaxID=119954 RepID=A0ACB9RNF8_9MYRT|nr:hypothetical protein MLD38_006696 [Melastoma candidum]
MVKLMVVAAVVLVSWVLPLQGWEFEVGGEDASWKLPLCLQCTANGLTANNSSSEMSYLVWKYNRKSDSVLEVTKQDYDECNTRRPIATYKGGNTKMTLEHSGAFYFVSGAEGHCQKGQKVKVIVLSQHHRSKGPAAAPVNEPAAAALWIAACEEGSASALQIARWIVSVTWIGTIMA